MIESNCKDNDAISIFVDEDEIENERNNNKSYESSKNNNANGKALISGLSKEKFFSLSHTLRSFSDCIINLLSVRKFKYILPR